MQVGPRRPVGFGQPVQHSGRQLPAAQVGHQLVAVVAVKAGPTVRPDVQPNPGPPTGGAGSRKRFGSGVRAVPAISAEPFQLVRHDLRLERPGRVRDRERQVATAGTVHAGDRAQGRDPIGRRLDHLDNLCVPIRPAICGDSHPHPFAGQRVADEHHPAVVVRHAAAAVRRRTGVQRQFRTSGCGLLVQGQWRRSSSPILSLRATIVAGAGQSNIPRRASPGAACG